MRRTRLRAVADGERVKAKQPSSFELCGVPVAMIDDDGRTTPIAAYSIHHRQPRGMGGTDDPAANSPANLLLLCGTGTTGCHGLVETQRALAVEHGWLVPHSTDPASVPVLLFFGDRVYLTTDGRYQEVE